MSAGFRRYQIGMGVGLLARLELLSRAIVSDNTVLRGVTNSKLTSEQARKDGRTKVMANFYFYFMITLVFMHELAHIVLGHIDWIGANWPQNMLYELHMTPQELKRAAEQRVLEADADHQAAKWALSMFDYSLGQNPHFKYKTLPDQFYDFGQLLACIFMLFEATEREMPKEARPHPDNDTRMFVSLAFLADYFAQYRSSHVQRFQKAAIEGALRGLGHVIHPKSKPYDFSSAFIFMFKNGEEIDRLGVREKMMRVETGDSSVSVLEPI